MSLRKEFAEQAIAEGANMSALCEAYGISRPTGYKWRARYQAEGEAGLRDRSRRPHHSPGQTPPEVEGRVVKARQAHPAWGGRKLKRSLENQGQANIPAPSTITEILRRHGLLDPAEATKHTPYQRFERAAPNELWQMDYKGHFALNSRQRCHPLTVLDDHSRYLLALEACPDETRETVQTRLTGVFRRYGLPDWLLVDNGPPWSDSLQRTTWTMLSVWLLRLGITVTRSRVRHPQTLGKDERLHRTLGAELLAHQTFADFPACQLAFDHFRQMYNTERPHEAHALDTPAAHYHASPRRFPDKLPALRFPTGAAIRRVGQSGRFSYRNRRYRVGKAFRGLAVGVLPDDQLDGLIHVYFNAILVRTIDLHTPSC